MSAANPLARVGFNPLIERAQLSLGEHPNATMARVVEIFRTHCVIHNGVDTFPTSASSSALQGTEVAVGDWVLISKANGGISARVPRYCELTRLEPGGAKQTVVANVDVAFLVMGLDADFNLRRLERYLAMTKASGVLPVIVLTKADLCTDVDARLDELAARLPPSIERHALDAKSPAAITALSHHLNVGTTGVVLGSSGAGKSTLTNTLMRDAVQRTNTVRESDGRGQHTTTSRQLRQLPSGGCLIDTPGLRGMRLDIDASALDEVFDDIAELAKNCRFRDCGHEAEPGCAVRAALPADRLANFQKLRREVVRDRATALEKQTSKAKVKERQRALRAHYKDKE